MYYGNVERMTVIIKEDVKNIPALHRGVKFYTFAGCFSLFIITEFVVLSNG